MKKNEPAATGWIGLDRDMNEEEKKNILEAKSILPKLTVAFGIRSFS